MTGQRRHSPMAWLSAILLAALVASLAAATALAQKESLQADTSDRVIAIESDFTGARIVVFGAVENSRQPAADSGYYDIIMVIRGPAETIVTRQKERFAGIWVNGRSEAFANVPSFYAVLSTRPLEEIADEAILRREGIEFLPKPQTADEPPRPDAFEQALIEIRQQQQLYVEDAFAVSFLGKSLFRGTLTLPAHVRVGHYTAEIYLLHRGKLLSQHRTFLYIHKAGIERELTALASEQPWVYGLLSVLVAVGCGLLGWTLFSRS